MPTTLKTPTPTQWQWLVEKAGWKINRIAAPGDEGVLCVENEDGFLFPFDSDGLPHNTDALMRVMDAVLDRNFGVNRAANGAFGVNFLSVFRPSPYEEGNALESSVRNPQDVVEAFQAAACDILAQLAEAEMEMVEQRAGNTTNYIPIDELVRKAKENPVPLDWDY